MSRQLIAALICSVLGLSSFAFIPVQQPQAPEKPSIQATVESVLVDVVVRDKKGRPVNDLKPEEIEVFEDEVKHAITGFRLVQPEIAYEQAQGTQPQQASKERKELPPTTLDHINLVTFVFGGLGTDGRHLATQACEDFIKSELHKNVLVSVFKIDRRLHVLQQFTNDAKRIKDAVKAATGAGTYAQYTSQSNAIRQELEAAAAATSAGTASVASAGRTNPTGAGGAGTSFAEAKLAEMTVESLRFSETMEREEWSEAALYSLLGLVRGQKQLAGRKTIIYFSEGLIVSPNRVSLLKSTVSEANRANVSFYAVDARGLTSASLLDSTKGMMEDAAGTSRTQAYSSNGTVSRSEVMVGENAEASLRMNSQGTLAQLAEQTGGFLIANTNDLREGVQHVGEDIRGYYELTYSPKKIQYDGRFRAITVRVSRPDVRVQSRSGYFAVPPLDTGGGPAVVPFEMPMLMALSAPTLAKDFDYRSRVLRFGTDSVGNQYVLVIEVPVQNFTFAEVKGPKNKTTYSTHFGLLAVVKDSTGQIVEKFSQDYILEDIPAEKVEARRGNVSFIRSFSLPQGKYTLETVARDEATQKTSGKRAAVMSLAPTGPKLKLSSLSVIFRTDAPAADGADAGDPLVFVDQSGKPVKIIPNIGEPIPASQEGSLGLYMVIYPSPGSDKPRLGLEVLQNGAALGGSEMKLPEAKDGKIQYTASLPLKSFKPGQYEFRAVVQQGQEVVEEATLVTIQ